MYNRIYKGYESHFELKGFDSHGFPPLILCSMF